jgi:hypothetical protein
VRHRSYEVPRHRRPVLAADAEHTERLRGAGRGAKRDVFPESSIDQGASLSKAHGENAWDGRAGSNRLHSSSAWQEEMQRMSQIQAASLWCWQRLSTAISKERRELHSLHGTAG